MEKLNTPLTNEEKAQLKKAIISSISRHQLRRRLFTYVPVAASLALLILFYFINFQNQSPWFMESLDEANQVDLSANDNITLVISDEETIVVEKDSVTIVHQGNQVQIQDTELHEHQVANRFNTLLVPYGKRTQLTLSDGTRVIVNSGSKLIYPSHFSGETREVFLEGEAIFKVTEDQEHPFLVLAENHKIEVLGTEFNVTSYPEDTEIKTVLKSGKVAISYQTNSFFKDEKTIHIQPGMLASYDKGKAMLTTREIDVEQYFSWEKGVFIFDKDPLETIMQKLSRYYGCKISIESNVLKNEKFSGYLDLRESVEEVLSNIQETTGFQYAHLTPNQILIK